MGVEGSDFRPRGKQAGPHYEKRLRAASVKTAPPGRHTDGGGLFLEVDPSGARRWLLRIVIKGRRRDLGLGSASLVSLADARANATPRKCLGYRTPIEAFAENLGVALEM